MGGFQEDLEKKADLLFKKAEGWNTNALKRIGRRIKEIGLLSHADLQALNNASTVKQDINAIIDELSKLTNQSAKDIVKIYSDTLKKQHLENKPLYDYRNKPFVAFADNKELQAIVRAYARTTMGTMAGLTMSKGLKIGTVGLNGNFIPLEKSFSDVLDKAVLAVSTGAGDFNSEMRDTIRQLGGSGLRIDYGGGVTRRVDSMVRQNLLWGVKQASVEYNEMIGKELDCDGIEIDWHSNPRPSHDFMQGKQYSLHGRKTIGGVTYESADEALARLQDYGCLHYKTPVILGVSEPRYSPEELESLNEQNKRTFEIDGKQMSGYDCKQVMRRLEREARITKEQIEMSNASGDNIGAQQLRQKLKTIGERYNKVADISGIKAQPGRMAYTKGAAKYVDNNARSGIIKRSGLAAKIGDEHTPMHEEPKLLKIIDYNDKNAVMAEIKAFEDIAVEETIETACVITKDGEVWKCFGIEDRVFPDYDLGDRLYGAYVSHNHPISISEFSFSENDFNLFMDYNLPSLRGVDEEYEYEFNSKNVVRDKASENVINISEKNYRHEESIRNAQEWSVGYWRIKRK